MASVFNVRLYFFGVLILRISTWGITEVDVLPISQRGAFPSIPTLYSGRHGPSFGEYFTLYSVWGLYGGIFRASAQLWHFFSLSRTDGLLVLRFTWGQAYLYSQLGAYCIIATCTELLPNSFVGLSIRSEVFCYSLRFTQNSRIRVLIYTCNVGQ